MSNPVTTTGFGDSEIAQKAKAIYEQSIQSQVEPEHIGKYLVIDVETGEWDMDADDYAASLRMFDKKPNGKRFAVRIGHRAAGTFRGGITSAAAGVQTRRKTDFEPIGMMGWARPATLFVPSGGVAPVRWTRSLYCAAMEAGILYEGARFELIGGQLLQRAEKPTPAFYYSLSLGIDKLREIFGERCRRTRGAITISDDTEVSPDYLVTETDWDSSTEHPKPSDVLLTGMVAEGNLEFELTHRARIFAQVGIREYWVTDIVGRALHIFRYPSANGYRSVEKFSETQSVSPMGRREKVTVSDLLP